MRKVRYKCELGHFLAETDGEVEIQAYCKRCGKIVKGYKFQNKRPRIQNP